MRPSDPDDDDRTAYGAGAPPAVAAPAGDGDSQGLRIGTRLAEFEITQRLGEGGFSIVYLAWDHSLDRKVALKEYMPASLASRVGESQVTARSERHRDTFEAGLKSFVNEGKLLAQFDHPALVKVYRFWQAHGTAYMVMPLYEGVTLRDTVRALPTPPDEAWLLGLLAPLTEALEVIHAEQCYHRDIAPDNVILLAGSRKPLLLDFGAARRVIGDMTQALTVILKPGYAPIEQYAEVPGMRQGPWTDVYALAAVVYWCITGKTPPAAVGRMVRDSWVPLATCAAGRYSARFLEAIDRALTVMPEARTQTIRALREELGLVAVAEDPDVTLIRPPRDDHTRARDGPGFAAAASTSAGHASRPAFAATMPKVLAAAGAGLAVLIAAAWWALRPAGPGAPALPQAVPAAVSTPRVADPAPGAPVVTAPQAAPIPPAAAGPEPARIAQPVEPAAAASAFEPAPPPRASTRAAAPTPGPATATAPERRPAKAAAAADRPKAERPAAVADNSAECARVLQRLSLGDSSPELIQRVQSLRCR